MFGARKRPRPLLSESRGTGCGCVAGGYLVLMHSKRGEDLALTNSIKLIGVERCAGREFDERVEAELVAGHAFEGVLVLLFKSVRQDLDRLVSTRRPGRVKLFQDRILIHHY